MNGCLGGYDVDIVGMYMIYRYNKYVCMYVCMHACRYVRMYVCM